MTEQRDPITPNLLIDKSIAIYGGSGTGKTAMIQHILWTMRGYIPAVVVFSKSDADNHTYSGSLVPHNFVYDEPTPEIISNIVCMQSDRRKLYEGATNLEALSAMALEFATKEEARVVESLRRLHAKIMKETDGGTRTILVQKVIDSINAVIDAHVHEYETDKMSSDEIIVFRYRKINPRIIIIIDDCTTAWKTVAANKAAKELIFQGRHSYCTTIISLHNDSSMPPDLRQNIHISIFTDKTTASTFAGRPSNINPDSKEKFLKVSAAIVDRGAPYTKMLFANGDSFNFAASRHDEFSAVADVVRRFCAKVTKKKEESKPAWLVNLANVSR